MATITLYSNEECTESVFSGFVGSWKSILPSTGSFQDWNEIIVNDLTVRFTSLWGYVMSTVSGLSDATEFPIEPTDTDETIEYYFTPDNKLMFRFFKLDSNTAAFHTVGYGIRVNDSWTIAGWSHDISFTTHKVSGKWCSLYFRMGEYETLQNIFGFDAQYYDDTLHETTARCFNAITPFDKYILETDEKQYEPKTGIKRRGGTGTGYYPNSTIPALPTGAINNAFSAVLGRGNGLTYYKLVGDCLEKITEFLYDTTLNLKFRNSQYRDAIASCIFIPYNVTADVTNSLQTIFLANKPIYPNSNCDIITNPLKEIDFGEVNLTAGNIGYKSFADYIHTTATLYLPCFGAVNIDMSTIANGILHLRGVIDVRNGNILYRLETMGEQDDTPVLYGQYNGNCGIPVPIGGANASPSILGAISSIGTIGVGVATGNPLNIIGGISSLASQTAPDIDTAGAMQPQCAALGTPVPILQIKKHIVSAPPDFLQISGYPADGSTDGVYDSDVKTLGDYSGYFQAADCDVSGIAGATESEKAEIEMLLKSGVFL